MKYSAYRREPKTVVGKYSKMLNKRQEEVLAKRKAKKKYEKEHPQPNPKATIQRNADPLAKYHKMVNQVTNWSLEEKKDVDGAFRYFEKTWIPAAESHLSNGDYSDVIYMSSAFLTQFPEFVERSECQQMLSALARDKKVRKLVRGMMSIGRQALSAADNPYLDKIAHLFMNEVRMQPFYNEYRIYTSLEDEE